MTRWLSRRHPRYIRSLVYMLQASEYNIRDFFKWHERTHDFRNVEKRKRLVFTPKATLLYAAGWVILAVVVAAALYVFSEMRTPWNYLLSAALLLEAPLIIMLGLMFAVLGGRIIQYPVEWFIVKRTAQTLALHRGIKIAIAGSYGKTSTREILRTVLSEGKKVAAPESSFNTPLGIASFVRRLKGDEEVLLFELGEYYPGDVRTLAHMVQPDWGIITGINEAHLEKFGSLEKTGDTVFELAEFVAPERLYANGEDERVRSRAKPGNVLYTRGGAGQWRTNTSATSLSGTTFSISKGADTLEATSRLLGLHMLGPLSVAVDLGSRLGLSKEQIEKGVEKTKPFAHRLEPKQWVDGVTFLDDSYNGNPDGVRAVIAFLASLSGRKFYVTPGLVEAGEQSRQVHEDIGKELARAGIEKIVLIRTSATPHIERGLKQADFKGEILWYEDMPSALNALRALTIPGDIILVQNDWPDQYA
ncbi:UDP-N-acetylmuramoyl-tripeptide--D-alanyl-D-alanine ligase [Candidatus Parcubacteria bacterium]|nr:MAG: UDP-N-acetylmuramoyl-tripeptide--D-alanyl-D-alanine ligase [Candidatus Parcubacteria bacterium]